jgi:hypothetical protein
MTTIPEPTLTHTERARAVIAHIRGIQELIDGFTFAGNEPDLRTLNASNSIPDAFLEEVAVAIEASDHLRQSSQVQPAELRDIASFSMAFLPAVEEMAIVFRGMRLTFARKRASVCKRALQTYELAKTFNRKTDRQVLMPHLDAMQKALGRKRPKPAAAQPDEPRTEPSKKPGGANA